MASLPPVGNFDLDSLLAELSQPAQPQRPRAIPRAPIAPVEDFVMGLVDEMVGSFNPTLTPAPGGQPGSSMQPPVPPKPAAPPPSKNEPLKPPKVAEDGRGGGVGGGPGGDQATDHLLDSVLAPQPVGEGTVLRSGVPGAMTPEAPVPGGGAQNESDADIRRKLGFSWGKGVQTHTDSEGLDRPVEDSAPGGAFARPGQSYHESRDTGGGYVFGGEDETDLVETVQRTAREQATRDLERAQVGDTPAPATRGERLEDQRRNARTDGLLQQRNAAIAQARANLEQDKAAFAAGKLSQEELSRSEQDMADYIDQLNRDYAMQSGGDPRSFNQPR